MSSYTDEQLKYINYNKKKNTKLLACAGSGKTRCIIARMERLIEKKIYDADAILMLTFSRFTRDDFLNKIRLVNKDKDPIIKESSIKTIDKFAKQIIDPDGIVDVSLLSYRLMKYLEETSDSELKKNTILDQVKIVFVDEAQDLNEIQYRIFCSMRDKLGVIINMIGDPNQNIYQFRKSSDKFLTEFEAEIFILTKNFRSHLPIVNFSKHLRPFTDNDVICTKGDNECMPIMMFYEDEKVLENNIVELLISAQEKNIDLSEFAILSPTRGRMRGGGHSHGLCFISNILFKAKIKFKQFYEEAVDEVSAEGIKYEPSKGHVNILTYMGSKGLEWNYVIIIDADTCLINKRSFNEQKHKDDQYLLYVACSRAIQNMYIFSKCAYKQGQYHFMTNPWFQSIPENLYQLDNRFTDDFFFPSLNYKQYQEHENRLSKLIDQIDFFDLDQISAILHNRIIKNKIKIYKNDYSTIEKPSAIFLSKYTEALFQALYNIKMNRNHIPFTDIEQILEGDNIVSGVSDDTADWYNQNKKTMTWEKFNKMKSIPKNIRDDIEYAFDKTKDFNTHIIALNGYYQHFILGHKIWIKNLYKKYIKCKNTSQIKEILFYLMVIKHSLDTQHYFHINSKGIKYEHILKDFRQMFDDIEQYVDELDHVFISVHEPLSRWGIVSRADMVDDQDEIWTIKCTGEISLKNIIQSIVSTLMHNDKLINDDFSMIGENSQITVDINYLNFMKGEEITYSYDLSADEINKIITILTKNIRPVA